MQSSAENDSLQALEAIKQKIADIQSKPDELQLEEVLGGPIKEDIVTSEKSKLNENQRDRLREIRLKLNAAKKQNSLAVLEEEKRAVDPYFEKNKKKEIIKEKIQKKHDELI